MSNLNTINLTASMQQSTNVPLVSIIMPVYNVQDYIAYSIDSVLQQTFTDFELILVDDGSTDASHSICQAVADINSRVRIFWQQNKGLAAARNTGIKVSRGEYLAFLDSDDLWHPDKLTKHVELLNKQSNVGVSYSSSAFIDEQGIELGLYQTPKCHNLSAKDVFLRNPIGNGSAPVIRRQVFSDIAYDVEGSLYYFNETLRQSEDIECWVRIATTTDWQFAGIESALTFYRVNNHGLSANVEKQFQSWLRACELMQQYAPDFIKKYGRLAKAFQHRYLARRAVRSGDAKVALSMITKSFLSNPRVLFNEPVRTSITFAAAVCLLLPKPIYRFFEVMAVNTVSILQKRVVQ